MYFCMTVSDAWLVLRFAEHWRRMGQRLFSDIIGHWSACQGTSSALVQPAAAKATTTAAAAATAALPQFPAPLSPSWFEWHVR